MKYLIHLFFLFIFSSTLAQGTRSFEEEGVLFQYEALNVVESPQALLVLFDGGAGKAKNIVGESAIPEAAAQYGFLVIGIDQSDFFLDESNYARIGSIIAHVKKENNLSEELFLGGFSLGGFIAVRFAEMAVERKDQSFIPKALFAVDPPLDHAELRQYCLRELERVCDKKDAIERGKAEARWILNYYEQHFGSFPENESTYIHHSCFSSESSDGGNATFLKDVPVALFHEVDLEWLMKERCRYYEDCNAFVGSKFINLLQKQGNKNAFLMQTEGLGYRADGRRHPHSWSIAEPHSTFEWLMNYLQP
jgi:hypothetical protein